MLPKPETIQTDDESIFYAPAVLLRTYEAGGMLMNVCACKECAKEMHVQAKRRGRPQAFCSTRCRRVWHERFINRAAAFLRRGWAWRCNRGDGREATARQEMTSALRVWRQEDKAAGRASW